MVAFNNIPGNILVPFFYSEINSGGTPFEGLSRLLLIGQKLAGGSATADVPVIVQSEQEVDALTGVGSMLGQMYRIARRNAPFQPIWILPLADPSGTAATATLTVDPAPAVTGPGIVRVMGRRIVFQVNAADTVSQVAAAMVAAINAAGLPVQASNVAGVVTVTARHVGTMGNFIEVKLASDEPNVLNASNVAIVPMAGGTGVPALDTALANLGDEEFDWLAGPYADTTSLNSIRSFLSDTSGRWSPTKQLYGHYLTQSVGNLSTLTTLGNGRNDQHVSIMGTQSSPTPPWEWAAALGGQCAAHLSDAPELSRPLQTLVLDGVLPPDDRSTWWDIDDRQALYVDGIAGYRVSRDGRVIIDRVVTTYQTTAAGVADATFRDVETMAQLMFTTRYFRTAVSNRHARQSLAAENPHNVAEMTTPDDIKHTLIHAYRDLEALGVLEKSSLFADFVTVEINGNRVNAFLPVDVVNQLRVFAANITAFLNYQGPAGAALL